MTTAGAEVLVIGAGPAGIAAATAAAENGRQVIVLDDNVAAGGQIWRKATVEVTGTSHRDDSRKWRALERLRRSGAQVLGGRCVFNAEASGTLQTLAGDKFRQPRGRIPLRTTDSGHRGPGTISAVSRLDLAGVFGAGGLQALVKGGYPVAGKRVVVAGTGPLLLAVAAHLVQDGAVVSSIVEQATLGQLAPFAASLCAHPAKLVQGARYRAMLWKTSYRIGCWVVEAIAASDGHSLSAVRITDGSRTWTEPCDLLACGYHLVPNTEIAALARL